MRLSFPTHRLAAAALIAGGAVGLLAGPGSAGAVVPGSNGLIVASKCEDGNPPCDVAHVWTRDPVSGVEHQLTSDPAYWDDDVAVSPDGSRVAYQRCAAGNCRIAVVGVDGGTPVNLTSGTDYEDYPAFSPDGSKIVFSRNAPNSPVHLVVMDASGGNEQPLTSGSDDDEAATWSSDGSSIAFERCASYSTCRIYKVAASGGSPVPVSAGPDHSPNFSPDGSQIVFSRNSAIWLMDAGGGNPHQLTTPASGFQDLEPAFSPDGTEIVFNHYSQATAHTAPLIVMNPDGSNQHAINPLSDYLYNPDWQVAQSAPVSSSSGGSTTGSTPPAVDTTAPGLTLSAPKKESVRKGRVYLFATSSEGTGSVASGKVAVAKLAKSYRLRPASKALAANTRTKVVLRIPKRTLRAVRAALARHDKAKATLVVRVKDSAGNTTAKKLKVRLTK